MIQVHPESSRPLAILFDAVESQVQNADFHPPDSRRPTRGFVDGFVDGFGFARSLQNGLCRVGRLTRLNGQDPTVPLPADKRRECWKESWSCMGAHQK